MKLKSITFECPVLFRGNVVSIEDIHAPELTSFINGITFNSEHRYLLVIEYNGCLYVVDFVSKKYNTKKVDYLSKYLHTKVSILEASLTENNTYSFEVIYTSENKEPTSVKEEILSKYPLLSLTDNTNFSIMKLSDYTNLKQPEWMHQGDYYFVVINYKEDIYIITKYRSEKKAKMFINNIQLENATTVHMILKNGKFFEAK